MFFFFFLPQRDSAAATVGCHPALFWPRFAWSFSAWELTSTSLQNTVTFFVGSLELSLRLRAHPLDCIVVMEDSGRWKLFGVVVCWQGSLLCPAWAQNLASLRRTHGRPKFWQSWWKREPFQGACPWKTSSTQKKSKTSVPLPKNHPKRWFV